MKYKRRDGVDDVLASIPLVTYSMRFIVIRHDSMRFIRVAEEKLVV
jgi:hypothetical protein